MWRNKFRKSFKQNDPLYVSYLDEFNHLMYRLIGQYQIDESEASEFINSDSNHIYINSCPYAECIDIVRSTWYREFREELFNLNYDDLDDTLLINRKSDIAQGKGVEHTFTRTLCDIVTKNSTDEIYFPFICDFIIQNCTNPYIEPVFFNSKLHSVSRLKTYIIYKKCIIILSLNYRGCDRYTSTYILSFI